MKLIALSQGQFAKVDDADFDWLNQWKWSARWKKDVERFIACRTDRSVSPHKYVMMHRFICPTEKYVDHRNGDSLDNQRDNLRPATNSQNQMNRGKTRKNKSGYKGVYFHKRIKRYVVTIKVDGKTKHLGTFDCPKIGAAVYAKTAAEIHGEFFKI